MFLSDSACRSAPAKQKQYKLSDGEGMYLLVKPSGGKYWRMNYRFAGKYKTLALGVYPEVSLREAREKRAEARKQLREGIDPLLQKQKALLVRKAENTDLFRDVATDWFKFKSQDWGDRNQRKMKRILEHDLLPHLGAIPIREILPLMLLNVLKKIESSGRVPTAKIARSIAGQIFRYAIVNEKADYDISASLKDVLSSHKTKHMSYLEEPELPEFFRRLNDFEGASERLKLALELVVYCFPRTIEIRSAKKTDFYLDGEKPEWRIPSENMKMDRPHIIPLAWQACNIINRLMELSRDSSEFLLPHQRKDDQHLSENSLLDVLYDMGYKGKATVHGFRSTASTILNENEFNSDHIELQLAHVSDNGVRASYNHAKYLESRRKMMQWYADHLDKLKAKAVSLN